MIEIGDYIKIVKDDIHMEWENDTIPNDLKVINIEQGAVGRLLKVNKKFKDSDGNSQNLIYEGYVKKDVYKSRINIINSILNEDDNKEH